MEILNLSNPHFYISIAIAILNGVLLCFLAGKPLQMLQLSGYKLSGYNAWLKDTKIKYFGRLIMLSFLSLISILVTNVLLDGFGEGYYSYLGLVFYIYFCIIFIINITKMPQKTPLKQTRRMNRLIVTLFVFITIISFCFIALSTQFIPLVRYGIIILVPMIIPVLVPFAHIINLPMENYIRNRYLKSAKNKLSKMPNLIKIGITGSYGKTTTKHILNVLLSKKYSVCMTPHSFNTPMGLTKVVLKYLKRDNKVLIAEMGAKNVGDIKYLCDLISPKHAIITSVGSQHLATFGSFENVAKTKNELVQAINDGYVVFNAENEGSKMLYEKCTKEKYLAGIEKDNLFCNIKNIELDENGSKFTLCINGKEVVCVTKLLGKQFLEDIALASAMAYKLGLSLDEISKGIESLKPMSHRMEVIKNNNLTILDNAYNSSVESSKASLETLALFKNSNKIIVTPGIVEMGNIEYEVNVEFGKNIAKVCDKVIIVNKVNLDAIKQGLLESGFDEKNILEAENLNVATSLLPTITKPNNVVLFENDLPDNYT